MRVKPLLLIASLTLAPVLAHAQDRPSSQVVAQDRQRANDVFKAATHSAVNRLYDQLAPMQLTSQVSLADYLRIMEAREQFVGELYRADQIGAPRWVDSYTCQVQLEVSRNQVKTALVRIASANPKRSPVSALQIQRVVERWPRQYIATGSATSDQIIRFRPSENVAWRTVSDTARREALAAAKSEAGRKAVDSVKPVIITDSKTIADGLAVPEVNQAVTSWMNNRPVTNVDFRDDLAVEVSLGVEERDFFNVVRNALERQKKIDIPQTDEAWDKVEEDFRTRFSPAIGKANVAGITTPPKMLIHLPTRAPDWSTQRITVEGTAKGAGPKLKTRADAERDAAAKLQKKIEALQLGSMTLGEAAKQDPRIARAITESIANARPDKADYRDGGVVVEVTAELRDLWDTLRRTLP